MNIQVKMTIKKETKGTYVFEDMSEDTAVPTLYVKKSAFVGNTPPTNIKLTITEVA